MSKHIHKELNQLGRHFTDILHQKFEVAFADDEKMMKAIERSKNDTTLNYDVKSISTDFDRA